MALKRDFLKNIKVLVIHDDCSIQGGANCYRKKICTFLKQQGAKVYLFTYAAGQEEDADEILRYEYEKREDKKFMHYLKSFYFNPQLFSLLRNWINRLKPNLIYLHHNYLFTSTVLLAGLAKTPFIQTVHDYRFFCPSGQGYTPDGKACHRGLGRRCYQQGCICRREYLKQYVPHLIRRYLYRRRGILFVAPSQDLKKCFENWELPAGYLPFYTELEDYAPTQLNAQEKRLLFVGGLHYSKGADILLEAFAQVLAEIPSATLDIVGDGPQLEELKQKACSLELTDKVIFHGLVEFDKVIAFYQNAFLVAVPSLVAETGPLVIYEAMAAARPVVASEVGSIPELVIAGKNGLLCQKGNVQQLSREIIDLLTHTPKAQQMGQTGRKMLENKFTAKHHFVKFCELIQPLTAKGQ